VTRRAVAGGVRRPRTSRPIVYLTAAARALAATRERHELEVAIAGTVATVRSGALSTLRLFEGDGVRLAAWAGRTVPLSTVAALDGELAALVVARGGPVLIRDAGSDSAGRRSALWREWGFAGYYGLPLPGATGPLGVLALLLPVNAPALRIDERRMLEMFAIQATLALRQEAVVAAAEHQRRTLETARADLLETARLAALGQLVSDVVHRVSNLLGAATLRMEALRESAHAAGRDRELRLIDAQWRDIGGLIGQLRRLSRPAGVAFGLDFDAIVDELVDLRRARMRARGIDLARGRATVPLPGFRGDRGELERAVLALLIEAEDAVGGNGGGTVAVTTTFDPMRAVVRLTVEDDGPPVAAERVGSMFDPLAPRGAGRGPSITLAAAHAIVAAHGGTLTVANRDSTGAVFTLELPAPVDSSYTKREPS
jgi:signal transduction histidine kinase